MAELAGLFRRQGRHVLHSDFHRSLEPLPQPFPDSGFALGPEPVVAHELYVETVERLLPDPELLHAVDLANDVDHGKRVQDGAVWSDDEVCRAALNLHEQRQRAAAGAFTRSECADVSRRIADERYLPRIEVRDHDFPGFAFRHGPAFGIDGLHATGVRHSLHLAARALMRNESAVSPTVAVANRTVQGLGNKLSLMREQDLAGNEGALDAGAAQVSTLLLRVQAEKIERTRISHDGPAVAFRQQVEIPRHDGFAHLESRQQFGREQSVAQAADPIQIELG